MAPLDIGQDQLRTRLEFAIKLDRITQQYRELRELAMSIDTYGPGDELRLNTIAADLDDVSRNFVASFGFGQAPPRTLAVVPDVELPFGTVGA